MSAEEKPAPTTRLGLTFSTTRQTLFVAFFTFFCAIDLSLLGLVSEQIHKYGNDWTSYPNGMFYHALGLALFATIFYLIFGLCHWALGHALILFCFFSAGVMFGTVAGILTATPFGHGLQCGNPVDSFPLQYQPFVNECSRITAIVGLSWTMFGLCVIGFFWFFFDKFSLQSRRANVYEPYVDLEAANKPLDLHKH